VSEITNVTAPRCSRAVPDRIVRHRGIGSKSKLTRSVRRVGFSDDTAAGRRKTAGGGGNAGIDTGISSGGGGGGGGTNQTPAMGDGGAWPADAPWSRFRC
jgi:hypothetical protein